MCVIFLAGVHGVGKGFLGVPVAKSLGMNYFTASQLIQEAKGRATWGVDKRVEEIPDNQSALIQALDHKRIEKTPILLDGHFVLRGSSGEIIRLTIDVFSGLRLSGIILLTDHIQTIANRLISRDGAVHSHESITELAKEESMHANAVRDALQIPMKIIHSPTVPLLTEAIIDILKEYPSKS